LSTWLCKPEEKKMRPKIAGLVDTIIDEAIAKVSSSGRYEYRKRNLFYVARDLFQAKYPDAGWYETYNGFASDYVNNRLNSGTVSFAGMLSEDRGRQARRGYEKCEEAPLGDRESAQYPGPDKANKLIIVEKMGHFELMVTNRFPERLDADLICSQGIGTRAVRRAAIQAERQEIPMLYVHDYDIAGLEMLDTVKEESRRVKGMFVKAMTDLALNRKQIDALGLRWESVEQSRNRIAKLRRLVKKGAVPPEEQDMLKGHRVELDALTPEQFLKLLEDTLRELDMGKTIPTEEQIEDAFRDRLGDEDFETNASKEMQSRIESEAAKVASHLLGGVRTLVHNFDSDCWIQARPRCRWTRDANELANDARDEVLSPEASEIEDWLGRNPFDYWEYVVREVFGTRAIEDVDGLILDKVNEEASRFPIGEIMEVMKPQAINILRKVVEAATEKLVELEAE